jgi:probable rRNA maturation factor
MHISITRKDKSVQIPASLIKRICRVVAEGENQSFDELNIHFVGKKTISDMHAEYFNDPTPTDCITFPLDGPEEEYRLLGDIFVCPTVALEYAAKNQEDPFEECVLYVVHGLLHLFGYDDINEKDRKMMKKAEKRYMEILFP